MYKNKKAVKNRITLIVGVVILSAALALSVLIGALVADSYPVKYENEVMKYSREYNVPPALVFAVINTESGFDPDAVSSADARGLMQITPETFEWLQSKTGEELPLDKLFEPETSIKYGTFFLSLLLEKFGNVDTSVAAYNAGMNAVASWLQNPEYSDDGKTLKEIPYEETSYYVVKINRSLEKYRELYDS